VFGSVAIITVCLQVWPWLRRQYPAVHRWSGRLFIFAGVVPAGICAVVLVPVSVSPFGNGVAAVLWFATTFAGFRMARKRRWAEHRRFMIYAFAITMQVVFARVLFLSAMAITDIDANDQQVALEATTWMGFVVNLVTAQLFLDWTARRRRPKRATVATTQPVRTAA
jgi:uncharacterized membrane protein YozB (DUF420 family)